MKKCLWVLILLTIWILPSFAMAKEGAPEFIVDDIIVTGSRLEQKNEKIPAQITVITAEDIKASGAQSVPEALKNLGGISIIPDLKGNHFNDQIDMGGFGETASSHVAVVVNGRKINSTDLSGISFISIPIENIEKIEVVHGGNSVLYGGDAMGGVINIITKEAKDGVHVWGEAGAGSHGTLKGAAGVNFVKDRFGGNASVVYHETDGYRDRSEVDRQSAYAKFSFFASDNLDLSLEANTTRGDYQMPGSLTKAQMDADRKQAVNQSDEGESQDDYYVFSLKSDWQEYGQLNIDLSCRNYERQDTMDSYWTPTYYDYDSTTLGANPQYVLDHALLGKDNRLTLGVEFYDTDYDRLDTNIVTLGKTIYDHDQTTAGFYAQDEFNIMDNLVLNMGGRYEDFETSLNSPSNGTAKDINETEWAWNIGLAYVFAPGSKIYTRAYQAYRLPRVDEYMGWGGVINPDLKHEKSKGYELGARFVGMDKKLSANARLYTFDVDDEIAYNMVTSQNENIAETRHQGGELDIKFQATSLLSLFGGMGYTNAELTAGANDGNKIPLVPEFKGNLGFALNFDFGLTYRCQYNYLGSRYAGGDYANASDKLDSANTVDMYAAYPYKNMEFFLNVTNIFNEKSATAYYAGFYPMSEAVYYGGIRFNF